MSVWYVFNMLNGAMCNISSSTSMQYMRSTGRSRIKIQGVEMGRIRVDFRDLGYIGLGIRGRFRCM